MSYKLQESDEYFQSAIGSAFAIVLTVEKGNGIGDTSRRRETTIDFASLVMVYWTISKLRRRGDH